MPRDKRLWMTFPIDMHRHPKITRLPVTARWAFFEMNGEARLQDNDGIFPAVEAEHEWGKGILDKLVNSHPTRPLVVRDGDMYRIRDYAEHQETRDARDARVQRNRDNGKQGGRPRKNPAGSESVSVGNRVGTESLATTNPPATHGNPESESESESELETDTSNTDQSSHLSDDASNADLTDQHVSAIQAELAHHADIEATADEARAFGLYVLSNAKTAPRNRAAYVKSSVAYNPTEVSQWFKQHRRTSGVAA